MYVKRNIGWGLILKFVWKRIFSLYFFSVLTSWIYIILLDEENLLKPIPPKDHILY